MSRKIETEKKYFCANNEELINRINELSFNLIESGNESDEYFTDIDSIFVKDRTCLRIRKKGNSMEVTYKGKSKEQTNIFSKLESSFYMDHNNYESFISLLSNIGYHAYTIVNKERSTYQIIDGKYTYSVMVDNIEELGGFVEFELISDDETIDDDVLKHKLNNYVEKFSSLNLEEASLPYRDFVALKIYNDYKPKKGPHGIHINLDNFMKKYEKEFYSYYKTIVKEETKSNIKLKAYRECMYDDSNSPILNKKIDNYFNNLKITDNDLIVLFELLKRIKNMNLKVVLSTNCNKNFVYKINGMISFDKVFDTVIFLNDNKSTFNELKKYDIDLNKYFNVSSTTLKETNSILFVIINNFVITN